MPENEVYDTSSDLEENDLEDDGILDASDTLEGDIGDDPLDTGAPAGPMVGGRRFGTTLAEERAGESLDQLLAEEEPDTDPYADTDPFSDDPLADDSEPRSGRLVADDEGVHSDTEPDLVAHDVGIDGGAASAEEAAVHVQDDDGGSPFR